MALMPDNYNQTCSKCSSPNVCDPCVEFRACLDQYLATPNNKFQSYLLSTLGPLPKHVTKLEKTLGGKLKVIYSDNSFEELEFSSLPNSNTCTKVSDGLVYNLGNVLRGSVLNIPAFNLIGTGPIVYVSRSGFSSGLTASIVSDTQLKIAGLPTLASPLGSKSAKVIVSNCGVATSITINYVLVSSVTPPTCNPITGCTIL